MAPTTAMIKPSAPQFIASEMPSASIRALSLGVAELLAKAARTLLTRAAAISTPATVSTAYAARTV
jgi:hypothetical protein